MKMRPLACAACTLFSASATVSAIGFSTSTSLPLSTALIAFSVWNCGGSAITTASMSSRAKSSSGSIARHSCSLANPSARAGLTSETECNAPSDFSVRIWFDPQYPHPRTAIRGFIHPLSENGRADAYRRARPDSTPVPPTRAHGRGIAGCGHGRAAPLPVPCRRHALALSTVAGTPRPPVDPLWRGLRGTTLEPPFIVPPRAGPGALFPRDPPAPSITPKWPVRQCVAALDTPAAPTLYPRVPRPGPPRCFAARHARRMAE